MTVAEDQEILMLSLHLLQISLVYVNTLMIQQVLAEPEWQNRLTEVDLRALSPLRWRHVNPYGTFTRNMQECLPLEQLAQLPRATLPKFGLRYLRAYNWSKGDALAQLFRRNRHT